MKFCRNFADNLENDIKMLKFSEIFEFSRENSYFERVRMVRMVRMVRSLADRTFQLCRGHVRHLQRVGPREPRRVDDEGRGADVLPDAEREVQVLRGERREALLALHRA